MSIPIGRYTADGPYINTTGLRHASGVYVILGGSTGATKLDVVDIGESEDVRGRVDSHDRVPCWRRQGHATLSAAAIYCNERERMMIERELRKQFDPPCGRG